MPPTTKRRSYLPQFYLRYFSNAKEQIRAYRTAGQRQPPFMSSVKKAEADAGAYTLKLPEGADAAAVERFLTQVDAEAKKAIDAILNGKFPPPSAERRSLATLMALYILTADWHKQQHADVFVHLLKDALGKIDRDEVKRHFGDLGLEPDDATLDAYLARLEDADPVALLAGPDADATLVLQAVEKAAGILAMRYWLGGIAASGGVCTSDRPVVAYQSAVAHEMAEGEHPEGAEQIYFPIGRRHVLALSLAGSFQEEQMTLGETEVAFVNNLIAAASERFVFQHPEDKPAKLARRKPAI